MREVNLSGLDLNLIPPLEALLRLRNVTRASAEVGLSQPAMSRALARLRAALGDPLLVRAGGGLGLTPRAQDLAPRVAEAMEALRGIYRSPGFTPDSLQRAIRIAAADIHAILVAPVLMARFAQEAPGLDVRFVAYAPDLMQRMERGEVDFAFAVANTPLPPGAASAPAAADRLAVVMRRGHPMAGRAWTFADYGRVDHVGIGIFGDGQSEIDGLLAAHGITRRMAFVSSHFMAALAVVGATDCVTTLSRAFASRFAPTFGLALAEPPDMPAGLDLTLVWPQVRGADPALRWMRGVIVESAREAFESADH